MTRACMLRFQGVLLALAPIVLAAPNDFKTCPKCIAAGYGWSTAKQKCGGFANKACALTRRACRQRIPPRLAWLNAWGYRLG